MQRPEAWESLLNDPQDAADVFFARGILQPVMEYRVSRAITDMTAMRNTCLPDPWNTCSIE